MRDLGLVRFGEPFTRLLTQGMVLNHVYSYQPEGGRKRFVNPADVDTRRGPDGAEVYEAALPDLGTVPVTHEGLGKMSKSEGNGVDPEGLVERFGADTARLFIMFASPPEQTLEWSDEGVQGAARFIRRLWNAVYEHVSAGVAPPLDRGALAPKQRELRRAAHQALPKATDDIGRRRNFNTAIAAIMELLNALGRFGDPSAQGRAVRQEALRIAVLVLEPITPHVCHVLWRALGSTSALVDERWPAPDARAGRGRRGAAARRVRRSSARPRTPAGPGEDPVSGGAGPAERFRAEPASRAVVERGAPGAREGPGIRCREHRQGQSHAARGVGVGHQPAQAV